MDIPSTTGTCHVVGDDITSTEEEEEVLMDQTLDPPTNIGIDTNDHDHHHHDGDDIDPIDVEYHDTTITNDDDWNITAEDATSILDILTVKNDDNDTTNVEEEHEERNMKRSWDVLNEQDADVVVYTIDNKENQMPNTTTTTNNNNNTASSLSVSQNNTMRNSINLSPPRNKKIFNEESQTKRLFSISITEIENYTTPSNDAMMMMTTSDVRIVSEHPLTTTVTTNTSTSNNNNGENHDTSTVHDTDRRQLRMNTVIHVSQQKIQQRKEYVIRKQIPRTFGTKGDTKVLHTMKRNDIDNTMKLIHHEIKLLKLYRKSYQKKITNFHCDVSSNSNRNMTINDTILQFPNNRGVSPLILACQKGYIEIVQLLLQYHVNVYHTSRNGYNALMVACQYGHESVVELLLQYMMSQQQQRNPNPLNRHIHGFASPVVSSYIETSSTHQVTSLMCATRMGHIKVVQKLLQYYIQDSTNDTLRIYQRTHRGMPVKPPYILVQRNDAQQTPFMIAVQRGHAAICQLFIDFDVQYNRKIDPIPIPNYEYPTSKMNIMNMITNEHDGTNALFMACQNSQLSVVKVLVSSGCQLYHTDRNGHTIHQILHKRMNFLSEIQTRIELTRRLQQQQQQQPIPMNRHHRRHFEDDDMDHENDLTGPVHHALTTTMFTNPRTENGIRICQQILHLVDPIVQVSLMQQKARTQRSYDIIKLYHLIHQQRATVTIFCDDNVEIQNIIDSTTTNHQPLRTYISDVQYMDVHEVLQLYNNSYDDPDNTTVYQQEQSTAITRRISITGSRTSIVPFTSLQSDSTQALIRMMILPLPIVAKITKYISLPKLWNERRYMLQSSRRMNANATIINTFDMIDEILEEGGYLSACQEAQIPAPEPYTTWYEWKLHGCTTLPNIVSTTNEHGSSSSSSSNSAASVSSVVLTTRVIGIQQDPMLPLQQQHRQLPLLPLHPPPPPPPRILSDVTQPNPCHSNNNDNNTTPTSTITYEQRRKVGYIPLLVRYQYSTNIVSILQNAPYNMPPNVIQQLLCISDIASICRRIVIPELSSSTSLSRYQYAASACVQFGEHAVMKYHHISQSINFLVSRSSILTCLPVLCVVVGRN